MIRTVISLDPDEKKWLDRHARQEHVTMTAVVREAVRLLRDRSESKTTGLQNLLEETRGLWTRGDGLKYQRRLRGEW